MSYITDESPYNKHKSPASINSVHVDLKSHTGLVIALIIGFVLLMIAVVVLFLWSAGRFSTSRGTNTGGATSRNNERRNDARACTKSEGSSALAPFSFRVLRWSNVDGMYNIAIDPILVEVQGTYPLTFTIVPELPSGLEINYHTGMVSGIPLVPCARTVYTIKASNLAGDAFLDFALRVRDVIPDYGYDVIIQGTRVFGPMDMLDVLPTWIGDMAQLPFISYWTISPQFAPGLGFSFDTLTGRISGTSGTSTLIPVTYTVRVENSLGDFQEIDLLLSVSTYTPIGPSMASFFSPFPTYSVGKPIDVNMLQYSGTVDSVRVIHGALPRGLRIETSSGDLIGTPVTVTSSSPVLVELSLAGGSRTSTSLHITVISVPPQFDVQSDVMVVGEVGYSIDTLTIVSEQGEANQYTLAASSPVGLHIDRIAGTLSGIPVAELLDGSISVCASNLQGNDTVVLPCKIYDNRVFMVTVAGYSEGDIEYLANILSGVSRICKPVQDIKTALYLGLHNYPPIASLSAFSDRGAAIICERACQALVVYAVGVKLHQASPMFQYPAISGTSGSYASQVPMPTQRGVAGDAIRYEFGPKWTVPSAVSMNPATGEVMVISAIPLLGSVQIVGSNAGGVCKAVVVINII
jgi:hypothetical protein